jgi:hypothetical protein
MAHGKEAPDGNGNGITPLCPHFIDDPSESEQPEGIKELKYAVDKPIGGIVPIKYLGELGF